MKKTETSGVAARRLMLSVDDLINVMGSSCQMSDAEIAETIGVATRSVKRWRAGQNEPRKRHRQLLLNLGNELGIPVRGVVQTCPRSHTRGDDSSRT